MSDDLKLVDVPISHVFPDRELPGDLYLNIAGKFIKYKNQGDELPLQKYELFIFKRVKLLYVPSDRREDYFNLYHKVRAEGGQAAIEKSGSNKKAALAVRVRDELKLDLFDFVTRDLDGASEEKGESLIQKTKETVETIMQDVVVQDFIGRLCSYGQGMVDHSMNVANLSSYLALNIGYGQFRLLEIIFLGGMLHDYGKTRIKEEYLQDPESDIFKDAMVQHAELGRNALMLDSEFSDEALRIVMEHHERHDGKGYPKGIRGNKIFDLTKIVSFANAFDNLVMDSTGALPVRQRKALDTLAKDSGKSFDPKILEKCLRAMDKIVAK
jgi:putative nucleotidyltransferase with HDIG domain